MRNILKEIKNRVQKIASFFFPSWKKTIIVTKPVTFASIGGLYEAKRELQDVMRFLQDKYIFSRLGAVFPKGVLLTGAPGSGKTMLAKAMAHEGGFNFLYGGGDIFSSPFLGEGVRKVRDFFKKARSMAPCIVFLDEVDSIARRRGLYHSSIRESENVLNVLLTELDGFSERGDIFLIGATNLIETLDPAILRPGRFDKIIHITNPSFQERKEILEIIFKDYMMDESVTAAKIASMTSGMTGAYLKQIVNSAAISAANEQEDTIKMRHIADSYYSIVGGGASRGFLQIPEKEQERTAYHEAGHAALALLTHHPDPILITILPRGKSLGCTIMAGPSRDVVSLSYREAHDRLIVLFGGYIMEELIYGKEEITSGSSCDLQQASALAYTMVNSYGWKTEHGFLVMEEANVHKHSESLKSDIDIHVRTQLMSAYEQAKSILKENLHLIESIKNQVLLKDTLESEDIQQICQDCNITPIKYD